jgi:hypothetical protein
MTTEGRKRVEALLRTWEFRYNQEESQKTNKSFWNILVRKWLSFAKVLGKANALILLTIVYFIAIGPGALILKLLRKDLLDRRMDDRSSYWNDKDLVVQDIEHGKHQF